MKAVVYHDIGDIRLDTVKDPILKEKTDAIIRITSSAICGTDLHMIRGTMPGMKEGTVLGHEAVGIIEEVGEDVRNFVKGDRVVVPSTIACGCCSYCRDGYQSQCDTANPNGSLAGTAFFGGPEAAGGFDGLQAEYARIPYAASSLVKLPQDISDDEAILVSDIFPTAYFGADLAEIEPGDVVAVMGCGPVGLFAVMSANLKGASRIFAIDAHPTRLAKARELGAETIDFNEDDPVEALLELTGGIGPDRIIEAVGIDATAPTKGPAAKELEDMREQFAKEVKEAAPNANPKGDLWVPGDAPSLAARWAVKAVAKAGTIGIIGVYPPNFQTFPIGEAMMKNLTIKMGNCPHRRYIPELLRYVRGGQVTPTKILSNIEPLTDAIEAYKVFDKREAGWIKVELNPAK